MIMLYDHPQVTIDRIFRYRSLINGLATEKRQDLSYLDWKFIPVGTTRDTTSYWYVL